MQPENNAQENSEESRLENAVKEVTAVEAKPAATEPSKKDNMFENTPKKSGKGMIFGLVLCAILAVGGIGFGVWAMMDGEAQKNGLNEQISALKTQNNELMDKLSAASSNATDTNKDSDVDTADYIYVGKWGLKIKVPEELVVLRHKFVDETNNDSSSLCVMGYNKKDSQSSPSFVDNDEYLTCISRVPKDSSPYGYKIFSEGDYDYLFNNAQTYYSIDENDISWEKESRELMSQVFGDADNYQKI